VRAIREQKQVAAERVRSEMIATTLDESGIPQENVICWNSSPRTGWYLKNTLPLSSPFRFGWSQTATHYHNVTNPETYLELGNHYSPQSSSGLPRVMRVYTKQFILSLNIRWVYVVLSWWRGWETCRVRQKDLAHRRHVI